MYEQGIRICREEHVPVLFHIQQVTQPQGHSTSGSHERYKSKERLQWEEEYDCIRKMREWMISSAIATAEECDAIESEAKKSVTDARRRARTDGRLRAARLGAQMGAHRDYDELDMRHPIVSVSIGLPGPSISSHQPGSGSSSLEAACALGESPVRISTALSRAAESVPQVS